MQLGIGCMHIMQANTAGKYCKLILQAKTSCIHRSVIWPDDCHCWAQLQIFRHMVCLYLSNLYCNNKRPAQSKLARDWSHEISQIFTFSSRETFSLPCPPRFCRVKRHIIILKVLPQWQMNRRGGGWLLTLHYDDYSLFNMIIHSSWYITGFQRTEDRQQHSPITFSL